MVAAAVTCGSVAVIVAALAAVYTWHRLRGPVPLVAWAASVCVRPQGKRATGLEEVSTPFKVPKNGVVQVKHRTSLYKVCDVNSALRVCVYPDLHRPLPWSSDVSCGGYKHTYCRGPSKFKQDNECLAQWEGCVAAC